MRHIKAREMLQLSREERIVLDKCRNLIYSIYNVSDAGQDLEKAAEQILVGIQDVYNYIKKE